MNFSSIMITDVTASFFWIFIVLFSVLLMIKRIKEKNTNFKQLPGPIGFPIIGASHIVSKYKKPWDAFSDLRKQYGDVYGIQLGSRNCVVVSSLPIIREVLVNKCNQFGNRPDFVRFHAIFRGDRNYSIALCDWSSKQKTRRQLTFPFMHPKARSFGSARMDQYIKTEMKELIQSLALVQDQVIEPRFYLLIATANIFYQFLCSKSYSREDPEFCNIVKIYDVVFRELFQGFAVDFMPWLKVFNVMKIYRLKKLAANVSKFTETIFEEHEKDFDAEHPRDLVDILLQHIRENSKDNGDLTREDVGIIVEDLLGGHSVLGNLWLWGLYFLADYPEIRMKIRNEVTKVTKNIRYPSLDDRSSMPYTYATILELIRIISSPIIPHVASCDTEIQGYHVPKNSLVMFNTCDLNLDPELWEKPKTFNPERFINEEGKIQKPNHFLPFSTGKRTCLGDGLVKATLFLGMSTLLQCFDIVLPPDTHGPDIYDVPGLVIPREEIKLIFRATPNLSDMSE
ncbi:cytochrome P450 307a1-like [Centruroides vittatus]|uniref:cytochrome P450 307a1-like n=1 Tax=Centruroides vittatus TaxID=120091 RepID=UPI00351098D6